MAVIVLNMFVMMIKHDGQAEGVDYALNILYDVWFVFSDYFKSSGGGDGGGCDECFFWDRPFELEEEGRGGDKS